MSSKFFTQRFYLDTPTNRYTKRGGENFVGPFRSFWVSKTNSSNFECDLVINPIEESGRGIPLRLNQCQAIADKAVGACVEFTTAQPGVWIDITFAQDDVLSVGSVVVDASGIVTISEGVNHNSVRVDLPNNAITEIIPADSNGALRSLQCKSGGVFWIGNPAELANADYKNICHKVTLAIDEIFQWRNTGALNAKTDLGVSIFSLFKGMKQ